MNNNATWLYLGNSVKNDDELEEFLWWTRQKNVGKVLIHMDDRSLDRRDVENSQLVKVLSRCHQEGLEVHGMISALHIRTADRSTLKLQNPDCYCVDADGISCFEEPLGGVGYFLDPAHPTVKEEVAKLCCSLLKVYPELSGIHLDFIRYYYNDSRVSMDTKDAGHLVHVFKQGSPIILKTQDGANITYFIDSAKNQFNDPPIGDKTVLRRRATYCFCPKCVEKFQKKNNINIPGNLRDTRQKATWILDNCFDKWREFRANHITELIAYIRKQMKDIKEDSMLSAAIWYNAPYGNELVDRSPEYESEYTHFGQKWWDWTEKGLVDFLCPMDYWLKPDSFKKVVTRQVRKAKDTPIYAGLLSSPEFPIDDRSLNEYEKALKDTGAEGFCFFNYATFKDM